MKMLVTGANGFVGSHLLYLLSQKNVEVIAVVRDQHSDVDFIASLPNVRLVYCDMDEIDRLPELVADREVDCCIHLAWAGTTGSSRGDYELQIRNVQNTMRLCEVLPVMQIRRFVGIGTLAEKDVGYYVPMDGASPNLVSNYGIAKLAAHYMTKALCTHLKIEHIWCQLSNSYGVGNETGNFVNFAAKLMLTGGRPAFTAGNQMYDFVNIVDVAKGIYLAALKGKTNRAYFIGSGSQRPLKEYIMAIRDAVDPGMELYLGEVPFNGVCLPDHEFDCSKLTRDTGYQADVSFETGIQETVRWLKESVKKSNGKD